MKFVLWQFDVTSNITFSSFTTTFLITFSDKLRYSVILNHIQVIPADRNYQLCSTQWIKCKWGNYGRKYVHVCWWHEMHLFCALTPTALCSVCVDRGNGEEESAPVCDLPGADSQADQHCRVGDMCWAVQPQWPGDVRVYFRVSKKQIIYCRWILPNPISKYNHTSRSLPSVDLARGGERQDLRIWVKRYDRSKTLGLINGGAVSPIP